MGKLHVAEGTVLARRLHSPGVWCVEVATQLRRRSALCYDPPVRTPDVGDRVVINTVAVDLGLGTGGYDFVVHVFARTAVQEVLGGTKTELTAGGHLVKLRYTPWQLQVAAVEEEDSPHHEVMQHAVSVDGMPVVVLALHSQLAPAAAALRHALGQHARIVFVMTDDAALPLAYSLTVPRLRAAGLLDGTVTTENAFGGDLEAITVFSGLLSARWVLHADAAIVGPGPGIAGTGTVYGTTAVHAGRHADAAAVVGGRAVVAPRLSFADGRTRHRGVSHHTLTALGQVAQRRCTVVLPTLSVSQHKVVADQLRAVGIYDRHLVVMEARGEEALAILQRTGMVLESMGRGVASERPLFLAAAAAGFVAADLV